MKTKKPVNPAKVLPSYGYHKGAQTFRREVAAVFSEMFGDDTDENLLFDPYKTIEFCKAIQKHIGRPIPETLITRTLVNIRKTYRRNGESLE